MSVREGPRAPGLDDEGLTESELKALLRSLRDEHARLAAEVAVLRHEVDAVRRELASRPLAARPAARSIAARLADTLRSFRRAVGGAVRIPLTVQPWAIALGLALLVAGLAELNAFQPVEVFATYVKGWMRGTAPVPEIAGRIVVVVANDASLDELGPWGLRWRAHHGQLLRRLADAGVRAVGFDVYFKTPSAEFDPAFLDGIDYARARGVGVVLGVEYDAATQRVVAPPPSLLAAATAIGSTYLTKDRVTNVIRYVAPFQEDRRLDLGGASHLVPSLSTAIALTAGKRAADLRRPGETVIPIAFSGASRAFKTVSYADAHAGRFAPDTFKDRHVLVGVAFRGSRDFFDTPNESQVAGVLIHADALYTMLRGIPRRPPHLVTAGVILAAAGLTALVCLRFQRLPRSTLIVTGGVIYWIVALKLASTAAPIDLDLVPATVTIALVWAALAMAEKVRIREEFWRGLGLPQEAVRRLEADRQLIAGTLVKPMTVLAIDARNYTVFSHDRALQYIRDIMLQYHEVIERVVYRHDGYVNKFVGDAVLVVFGYPRGEEDTATRAIRAAMEIDAGVRALREQWAREGKTGIEGLRMGINTGDASISYQGSSKKQLDILGETVDLASRLEGAAREFDAVALLGRATYELVKDHVRARRVGVTLKNLPHVTTAYALEGSPDIGAGDEDAPVDARAVGRR